MKEIYVSLSAAMAREQHLAMLANNLANVNTVGFKKETAVFEVRPPEVNFDAMTRSANPDLNLDAPVQYLNGSNNYMRIAGTPVDYSAGTLKPTSRSLDMALDDGQGTAKSFFVVQTPQGDRLTRMGNFELNADRELVSAEGYPVKSVDGNPITLDSENIEVSRMGEIASQKTKIGQLQVMVVADPGKLEKVGNGLFSDRQGTVDSKPLAAGDGVSIRSGCQEMSNVNVVDELTRLIETQRVYSTYEKSIQSMDDMTGRVITQALA